MFNKLKNKTKQVNQCGWKINFRETGGKLCAKNNYIWSRRLKDTSKNRHWPHFFGPPGR